MMRYVLDSKGNTTVRASHLRLRGSVAFCFGVAVSLSTANTVVTIAQDREPRTVYRRADLALPDAWVNTTVTLVTVNSDGGGISIADVQAKTVAYSRRDVVYASLSRIESPLDGLTYVVRGGQSFYLADRSSGIRSWLVDTGLAVRDSLVRTPTGAGEVALLEALVDGTTDATLAAWAQGPLVIDLRQGVPNPFWTARGGLDSQGASPAIDRIDVADGILQLDLSGGGTTYNGSFWVNLTTLRLLRSVVDGRTVFEVK